MENPNIGQQATAAPSISSILKEMSDDKAHVLFNSIAVSDNNNGFIPPLKEMNLSTKQYYSRISGLSEAGLIKRRKSTYSLTLLGRVVYESQRIIGEALSNYWKLKAIETIEMSGSNLPAEEVAQLINTLIDDPRIKDILVEPTDVSCDKAKSKIKISTPIVPQKQT
jgi:predicted transcriptional regulator